MIIKHPRLIIKQHGTIKIIDTLETYQTPHDRTHHKAPLPMARKIDLVGLTKPKI